MASRLALLAAKGPYEGPWMRTCGHESAVVVSGLGEGEELRLDCDDTTSVIPFNGTSPFPKPHPTRYRIRKSEGSSPTTARVVMER